MIMGNLKRTMKRFALVPRNIKGFLAKDYTLLFRKRKYFYLSIMLPLIIGLIYIFTLTGDGSGLSVKACDYDNTSLTAGVLQGMEGFKVKVDSGEGCTERLRNEIINGKYIFGILVEEGFTEKIENLQQSEITVFYDNSDPSIAGLSSWRIDAALSPFRRELVKSLAMELKDKSGDAREKTTLALEILRLNHGTVFDRLEQSVASADADLRRIENIDPEYLALPIVSENRGVHKDFQIIDVGMSPLFSVLSLFLVLMLCSTGVIYDRKMRLFSRIRSSSSSMLSYIAAKLVFFFTVVIVQFAVVLVVFMGFGARYSFHPVLLLKALVFIASVNALLGFLIGVVSDSEGVAVLISLIITLPLLFLSGLFYPLKLMPVFVQWAAKIMPLQTEILMMNKAMLFGGSINNHYFWIPAALLVVCMYLLKKV